MANSGMVETVLGPVDPAELGHTLSHEHVLIDLAGGTKDVRHLLGMTESTLHVATPESGRLDRLGVIDPPASRTGTFDEEIRLDNLYDQVKNWLWYGRTLTLAGDDADEAVRLFGEAGGSCIVDCTVVGMGRDPEGLRSISRRSGVHLVMGTGFYLEPYHPESVRDMSEEAIAEFMIAEIEDGVYPGGPKPGMIGEMAYRPENPQEDKTLRAALRASTVTGVPVTVHPGEHEDTALAAARLVVDVGADPGRVCIGHMDSRAFTVDDFVAITSTGCHVALDAFGREISGRQRGPKDQPNDAGRINFMVALAEAGYGDQVMMAQDAALTWMHRRYGGWGFHHILETVIPLMRYKNVPEELIQAFSVDNPNRFITIA